MPQADDWSWDRYRPLLKLQFRQLELDPRFQRRFDGSDLVQDAVLKALENFDDFCGKSEGERLKWLQTIFHNNAIDKIRAAKAGKTDVRRDQSIDDVLAESSARWNTVLGIDSAQPEHEAERREFLLRLAAAMETLSQNQRDAILLVQLMHVKVSDAAEQMGRTEKSVSGLVCRGLEKLRTLMPEYEPANL